MGDMQNLDKTINDTIRDAVKAKTQAAIIEAFGGADQLIGGLIDAALNSKVKKDYRDVPWFAVVCEQVIHQGVKDAMSELLDELRPEIRKEMRRRITADRDSIVDALMAAVVGAATAGGQWRMNVILTEPKVA